jgi:basic membrane protein A and related proteins
MKRPALFVLLALVLALGLVACGGGGADEDEGARTATDASTLGGEAPGAETSTNPEGGDEPTLRVGLVTDIGGLNDRSFNFLANRGLEEAEQQLGIEGRVLISRQNSDYVPNLSTLARDEFDLVIAVGFLMADAVATAAKRFPDTNFAIIDFSTTALKGKPSNVRGLLFKEQEAGYLAGYLAGLLDGVDTVSTVGGVKIPPVDRYIAGFQAGAKAANAKVKTLNAYSEDFVAQDKCKELALNQIDRGSDVVFQVAGQCGLGALDAAKTGDVWGIGVDADQAHLGAHILTSAVKRVDSAVLQAIQLAQEGDFTGGEDSIFDVASEGVGLGEISDEVPEDIAQKVEDLEQRIADGDVRIPDTVK